MTEKMIANILALAKDAVKAEDEYAATSGATAEVWTLFLTYARAAIAEDTAVKTAYSADIQATTTATNRARAGIALMQVLDDEGKVFSG